MDDCFSVFLCQCSATCGPGVQRREVVCMTGGGRREGDGGVECGAEKPADMKACNGGPCTPTHLWYTGPWGQVRAVCIQQMSINYIPMLRSVL